jgi:hypothetical protein
MEIKNYRKLPTCSRNFVLLMQNLKRGIFADLAANYALEISVRVATKTAPTIL